MHAHESHPDDETLFDLIEGALDEARAREIEAHLDACASCGALVQASLDGSPDSGPAIVPMSSEAVDALDGAITSAWRARTKVIAAHEAADDLLAPTPFPDMPAATTPIVPLPARPARAGRRGGFRAWAVPAFALIVLSVLGGTSLMIDREAGVTSATTDRGRAAGDAETETAAAPEAGDASEGMAESNVESMPSASAPGAIAPDEALKADSPKRDRTAEGNVTGALQDDEFASDDAIISYEDETICIATRDSTALVLPNARTPERLAAGPLGIYVICG